MPSEKYNQGFSDGEADRNANNPKKDVSGKYPDCQLGYEHGYTGIS